MNARFVNYQILPSLGLFVTEIFFLNEKIKEKRLIINRNNENYTKTCLGR